MVQVTNYSRFNISVSIPNNLDSDGDESFFDLAPGHTENWNRNPNYTVQVNVRIEGIDLRFEIGGGDALSIDPTGVAFCNGQRVDPL